MLSLGQRPAPKTWLFIFEAQCRGIEENKCKVIQTFISMKSKSH